MKHNLHDMSDAALDALHGKTAATSSNEALLQAIEQEQDRRRVTTRRAASADGYIECEETKAQRKAERETLVRNDKAARDAIEGMRREIGDLEDKSGLSV